MNGFIRFTIGALITACGLLVLFNSANMSYQGYERAFDGLTGAGLIGVGISGLAFFCSGAIGVASRTGLKDVAIIAAIMAVVCFAGDVYGNNLATGGEVAAERNDAIERQAAFAEAQVALPVTRERIAKVQSELETISGDDIRAAQRLLKAKGLYDGKIDGAAGNLTEKAMDDFGARLRERLSELSEQETSQAAIIAAGAGELPSENAGLFALVIAFLLSALSMAASAIGLPLMVGRKPDGEEELNQLEKTMDAFEAEVFDFAKWLEKAA